MDALTPTQQLIADTAYITNDSETIVVLVQDGQGPADGLAAARRRMGTDSLELLSTRSTRGGTFVTYAKA